MASQLLELESLDEYYKFNLQKEGLAERNGLLYNRNGLTICPGCGTRPVYLVSNTIVYCIACDIERSSPTSTKQCRNCSRAGERLRYISAVTGDLYQTRSSWCHEHIPKCICCGTYKAESWKYRLCGACIRKIKSYSHRRVKSASKR